MTDVRLLSLIEGLNQRAGLSLRVIDGACAFEDEQGGYWQISLGSGSEMLAIERTLDDIVPDANDAAIRMLEANTRHDLMHGAALGVDPLTRQARLMLLLRAEGLEAVELENALLNLINVCHGVLEHWAQPHAGLLTSSPVPEVGFPHHHYVL